MRANDEECRRFRELMEALRNAKEVGFTLNEAQRKHIAELFGVDLDQWVKVKPARQASPPRHGEDEGDDQPHDVSDPYAAADRGMAAAWGGDRGGRGDDR